MEDREILRSSTADRQGAIALAVSGITKTYGRAQVLRGVDLSVRSGEVHSLVGGNGSGKSTLVKILAGLVRADDCGSVRIGAKEYPVESLSPAAVKAAGVHFVHQDPGVFPTMTVTENLSIGRGFETGFGGRVAWGRARARARDVLARFGIRAHPDAPLLSLRPAERTMVAIARALQDQESNNEGILVLDEPTAALSAAEVDLLLTALRSYAARGQTILFISHRLDEVLSVSDRISVLRDGELISTKSAESLDHHGLAALVVGRELQEAPPTGGSAGRPVLLEVKELSVGPLNGINLVAHRGEIVGLAGLMGSGRSRLLHALFGGPRRAGTVLLDGSVVTARHAIDAMEAGFAMVPEDRGADAVFADMSVANNFAAADVRRFFQKGHLSRAAEDEAAAASVAEYGVVCRSVRDRISMLSGGNQQKVILARWLRRNPKVLLLDEPSQGVDVGARSDIHAIIRRVVGTGATALVASSDLEELALLCDRVVVFADGQIAGEVYGPGADVARMTEMCYGRVETAS